MSHGSLRLRLRFDRELDCDALQKLTRYIMCVHPFLRCSSCMRVISRLFLEGQMHASAGTSHRTCPLICWFGVPGKIQSDGCDREVLFCVPHRGRTICTNMLPYGDSHWQITEFHLVPACADSARL